MAELNSTTLAFLLNEKLDFTMFDFCRYIEDEFKSIDVYNIKKRYIQISNQTEDMINNILSKFIKTKFEENNETIEDESVITENIDVFFDVSVDKSNDSITIERASYN